MRKIDYIGQTINGWLVLAEGDKRYFLLRHIVCGYEKIGKVYHLPNNLVRCDYCYESEINYNDLGLLNPRLWKTIKQSADNREIEFNITQEEIWNLFISQDKKCSLSGEILKISDTHKEYELNRVESCTASLDRKDSSLGYNINNVQWVHKTLNRMKQKFSDEEFVYWCCKVADYHRNKPAETGTTI